MPAFTQKEVLDIQEKSAKDLKDLHAKGYRILTALLKKDNNLAKKETLEFLNTCSDKLSAIQTDKNISECTDQRNIH